MAAAQRGLKVAGWYLAAALETRAANSEEIVTILKGL
jgi:hypothetical protein